MRAAVRRPAPERWQSGRMYLTRNQAYGFPVPRVRIPPSPPDKKRHPQGCLFYVKRCKVSFLALERHHFSPWGFLLHIFKPVSIRLIFIKFSDDDLALHLSVVIDGRSRAIQAGMLKFGAIFSLLAPDWCAIIAQLFKAVWRVCCFNRNFSG